MPWQTAPPLIIIGLAFNAAAGLMWGAQRLGYGEVSSCLIFFHWMRVVLFPSIGAIIIIDIYFHVTSGHGINS
jgi:hypothetical protein